MTANAGKDANGQSGKRPTGADAEGGRTRKKTSAAKPPSDEVTVKTNADDDTNGSAQDPDETVVDIPAKDDDTVQDAAPADEAPSVDEDDEDDDVTSVDAFGSTSFSSSSSSSSSEESSSRTASFGLPKDLGSAGFGEPENDGYSAEKRANEPATRDDAANYPREVGESMPSSGRSAAMDSSTSSSRALGGGAPSGSTPPSYAPGGLGAPSGPTGPAGPAGSDGSGSAAGASGRAAIESAAARVSKLTGSLRKPDKSGGRKAPRKAHLQVARFEPWSVMKFSFIMSLVCFLVLFVAVAVLYVILSWLGVFDALSNTIHDLTSNDQGKTGGLNPASWFSAARILGYTALIGTLNVLLITALATVWSVIYNMAADLVGGVEVTLKEADS
jgi:hypothetical protein